MSQSSQKSPCCCWVEDLHRESGSTRLVKSRTSRQKIFLESASPQTLIALAAAGYGIAVIPSSVLIANANVRTVPLLHRGRPIGRWTVAAWYPQRFLAPYAEQFVEELVRHTRKIYPNREVTRRAPALPRPRS